MQSTSVELLEAGVKSDRPACLKGFVDNLLAAALLDFLGGSAG